VADSGSGGPWASYDRGYLQDHRRQLLRDLSKPLPSQYDRTSDIKQRWQARVDEINTELSYREHARRAPQRPPREGRPRPQGDRPAAAGPIKLAGDALRDYFRQTKINPWPRHEATRVDLAWTHGGQRYLGIYLLATNSLEVWVEVYSPGNSAATLINGAWYRRVT